MTRLVRVSPKPGKRAERGQHRPARAIRLAAEGGCYGGPYTPPDAPFRQDLLLAGGLFSLVWKIFSPGMPPRGY